MKKPAQNLRFWPATSQRINLFTGIFKVYFRILPGLKRDFYSSMNN